MMMSFFFDPPEDSASVSSASLSGSSATKTSRAEHVDDPPAEAHQRSARYELKGRGKGWPEMAGGSEAADLPERRTTLWVKT